ncbi:MAG TPA: hypothetical protein VES97_04910 [Solirubrobacteraceae bacterium]|nr:hypothetical protein [Solirubrobacteraceae bacterium]
MSAISRLAPVLATALLLVFAWTAAPAGAEGLAWRLEQPPPPEAALASTPIALGRIGDVEFWAPNRGLLITAGNGSTIRPGLWAYNGKGWHQLATVCGATDGRIAWAGPDEFWTISDGRPGQAASPQGVLPNLEDNTLCRFSHGSVIESFAKLAFQADSYEQLHAAGCIDPSDCWFAGDQLPEPRPPGSFHLHWNGRSLTAEPNEQSGHAVLAMSRFDGHLYESVRLLPEDRQPEEDPELGNPAGLHRIEPEADRAANEGSPFARIFNTELQLPKPGNGFEFLQLGADEEALWAAAGPNLESSNQVTVVRKAREGEWEQVVGRQAEEAAAGAGEERGEPIPTGDAVMAIAAEPGGGGAWIALDSQQDSERPSPTASALVAHISANGAISEEQPLPSPAEGIGPRGAGYKLDCPAPHDCWLATTQGWLFHLAPEGERQLAEDTDPAFSNLITTRPTDESVPQVPPTTLPVDDSGLAGELSIPLTAFETSKSQEEARVTVPLLSNLRTRLVHGTTLELRFHLAVKARVRLLAKRHRALVAGTPMRTLAAGNRALQLRLDRRRWPTALQLQTHALAPLPTVSTRAPSVSTVSTSLAFPKALGLTGWGSQL